MDMNKLTIGRGIFRLWIVLSVIWSCVITMLLWPNISVAWPWSAPPMIHVKFSDKETWDYPAAWGIERIQADTTKRAANRYAEDRKRDEEWIATIPADRKAFCYNWTGATDAAPKDCQRLLEIRLWGDFPYAVPQGWEIQFNHLPISVQEAAGIMAPLVVGPPLLLLVLSLAFGWVIKGFWPPAGSRVHRST